MDRMKTFFKYFLAIVLLFVFSNYVTTALLKTSNKKITNYEIAVTGLYVDVEEARASNRSGNIKGIVKNNTNEVVKNKYLKFTMFSKYNNVVGEKYVRITRLDVNQLKKYEVDFDFGDIKSFKVELTDTIPKEMSFFELVKEDMNNNMQVKIK